MTTKEPFRKKWTDIGQINGEDIIGKHAYAMVHSEGLIIWIPHSVSIAKDILRALSTEKDNNIKEA